MVFQEYKNFLKIRLDKSNKLFDLGLEYSQYFCDKEKTFVIGKIMISKDVPSLTSNSLAC